MQSTVAALADSNDSLETNQIILDPDQIARKTLDGKTATNKQLAKRVADLMKGDPLNGVRPLSQNETMVNLGYKDKKSIRQLRKLAEHLGYFSDKVEPTSQQIKEWKLPEDIEEFKNHPDVSRWVKQMKTRAKGGRPFEGYDKLLKTFHRVCLTLKIDPHQFIAGSSRDEILAQGIKYMESFMELYLQKKAKISYNKKWTPERVDWAVTAYSYSKPVRDFMSTMGYPYPDGTGGVMSQSVAVFHGKYSDVRLTLEEYRQGKEYIKSKWGIDSDVFRWFAVGVEALPRKTAIHSMKNYYEEFTQNGHTYYDMSVTETKTIQHRKGKWKKIIFDADTQESIRLSQRHGSYVIAERTIQKIETELYPKLVEVYVHLNKAHLHCRIEGDESTSYFREHPSHTLRHCGAQIWLRLTKWNVEFVAAMGWKKAQELIDSYGEMPADMRMEVLGAIAV